MSVEATRTDLRRIAEARLRPFSCGTQYLDWDHKNCGHCKRSTASCAIAVALEMAHFGDGRVSADIARRMGAVRWQGHYCWPCAELEPVSDDVKLAVADFEEKYGNDEAGEDGGDSRRLGQ